MLARPPGGDATARRTHQQALLDEVRLADVLERVALFGARRRQGLDPNRATIELLHDAPEQIAVELVQSQRIHPEALERRSGDVTGHPAIALDLGEVAHATQKMVGDPRRPSRAPTDL